jgi:thiamine pyrophosphokinase
MDHIFALRSLFERERCPDRWVISGMDMYCLNEGNALSLKLLPESLVSVFPLGAGPWRANSLSLKWGLDDLIWNRGMAGLSNVAVEGRFSIRVLQGRFMVMVPLEVPADKSLDKLGDYVRNSN